MSLEAFFNHFELLADAPNAVQRLRELILQLAVRGKLISQDQSDESASLLLKKLKKKKEKFLNEAKVKQAEALPITASEKLPYSLPQNWLWVRLSDVALVSMGQSPPGSTYNSTGEGVPLINGPVEFGKSPFSKTTINQYTTEPTKMCQKGDLLLCVRGSTTGRTNIAGFEACIGRGVAAIRAFEYQEYINYFVLASRQNIYETGTGSTFPSVSSDRIINFLFPLPPLEEQKRIVAKVDRLMQLCDELEERQQERRSHTRRLNEGAIAQLLTTTTPDDFTHHWQRICNNFDLLYSLPENITQLRQAILQLAVQGKLVPQDPDDEPASILAKVIELKKQELLEENNKKSKELIPIRQSEAYFIIPSNWSWIKLGELGIFLGGGTPSKSHTELWEGSIPWVSPKDMKVSHIYDSQDHISEVAFEQSSVQPIPPGSLLMVVRGMILAHSFPVAISKREIAINQDMKALILALQEISNYLLLVCQALKPQMLEKVNRSSHGTCKLNFEDVENFLIPLPPLEEQKRIVAKVDRLMALCDRLEADLRQAQTGSDRLMETAVRQILTV